MMSPVEDLTDLPAEIEAVKHELAERRAHLDGAEGKLGEAMAAGDFEEASATELFVRKEQLATECALLESRVEALEARLVVEKEHASREQDADAAERLEGMARQRVDTTEKAEGSIVELLNLAADKARTSVEGRVELANLRARLDALSRKSGLGFDARSLTVVSDLSRNQRLLVKAAVSLILAVLDRQQISTGRWAEFENRRKKVEIDET